MDKNIKLSVILATRNEGDNIARCLESVKGIADELIVVDENSTDHTRDIARELGAKVYIEPHHEVFHVTKQIALEKAHGEWVLQLDADEVVTPELARDIESVINGKPLIINPDKKRLFERHQRLIEERDDSIRGKTGEVAGYFIPRRNMFLGKPLIHAGVYPDGVIRLVKNGKARFPQKSVHEQIVLNGRVGWLSGDLLHYDSPTMRRYLMRFNRYTDLQATELESAKTSKNFFYFCRYTVCKPVYTFCNLYFRHLGFLDGAQGFLWSFFSAMHFPISYYKYLTK